MRADEDRKAHLMRLQRLLDAYGGDQRRWPRGAAAELAPLLDADPAARDALAEAKALDLVLAAASAPDAARSHALADRILAATSVDRAPLEHGNVVDLAARRAAVASKPASGRASWQAAAALAASLLLGLFVGASDLLGPSLDGVAALAGLSSDPDGLTTALVQALQLPFDEETL